MATQLWATGTIDNRSPLCTGLLARVIRCNCKTDCMSRSCTCQKHGLECSLACEECKGLSCLNSQQIEVDFDVSDVLDNASVGADLPDLGDISSFLNGSFCKYQWILPSELCMSMLSYELYLQNAGTNYFLLLSIV